MKKSKMFALLLAVLMLTASFPLSAFAAANDIFFATDVHRKTSNLTGILSAVSEDAQMDTIALGGDYEVSVSSLENAVDAVFPNAEKCFTTGNHDEAGSGLYETGEALVNEHFALYIIAYEDFKNAAAVEPLRKYLDGYNKNEKTEGKPLFVLSHLPLHKDRRDNTNAYRYAQLLNEAGRSIDIVYLWGHNHTVDRTLYFESVGETLTPEGGSAMTLSFTYVTAGYIKEGYGLTVRVNDKTIDFQRYTASGKYGSAMTVNRIKPAKPAHDCKEDGHIAEERVFDSACKGYVYVCKQCKEDCRERLAGDCDGDGAIAAADARMALRCSVGLDSYDETQRAAADVDCDGTVSAADARVILRKSVSLHDDNIRWKPIPVDKQGHKIA